MEVQQGTGSCRMYVDYEDFMVGLSHLQQLDVDNVLIHLLERARQRLQVQAALAFGDWTSHVSQPRLEEQGFICRTISGTDAEASRTLQAKIASDIKSHERMDLYLLVSWKADLIPLLRQLNQEGRAIMLWT